jgi:hypothetical protein
MYSVTESHRTGALMSTGITVALGILIALLAFRDAYVLAVPTGFFALYFLVQAFKYWRLHRENGAVTLNLYSESLPESREFEGEMVFDVTKKFSQEIVIELQCLGRDNRSSDLPMYQDHLATMRAKDVSVFQKSMSAPLAERVRFKFSIPQDVPPSWAVPRTLESRDSVGVRWVIGVQPADPKLKGPCFQFDLPHQALMRELQIKK